MIARRHFLVRFLGTCGGMFLPASLMAGTKNKPAAAPKSGEPPTDKDKAQVRLWKVSDSTKDPVGLRFLLPGKSESAALTPLRADDAEYQFSGYVEVPAGPMVIEATVPGRPTVTLPCFLAAKSFSTLLVRYRQASLSLEWIDDTPLTSGSGCVFQIFDLLPDSGDVVVNLGTLLTVHLPSARSSLRLSEIKPSLYSITIKGTDSASREFSANLDVDFTRSRQASLIICPDAYGRIRPRINAT